MFELWNPGRVLEARTCKRKSASVKPLGSKLFQRINHSCCITWFWTILNFPRRLEPRRQTLERWLFSTDQIQIDWAQLDSHVPACILAGWCGLYQSVTAPSSSVPVFTFAEARWFAWHPQHLPARWDQHPSPRRQSDASHHRTMMKSDEKWKNLEKWGWGLHDVSGSAVQKLPGQSWTKVGFHTFQQVFLHHSKQSPAHYHGCGLLVNTTTTQSYSHASYCHWHNRRY